MNLLVRRAAGGVHVAELNQKLALRELDHPGDREVRDIVSIFTVTRSARTKTERERERRSEDEEEEWRVREKNRAISERKHAKSIVTGLARAPRGILRLSVAWKSHDQTRNSLPRPSALHCAEKSKAIGLGRRRRRRRGRGKRRRKRDCKETKAALSSSLHARVSNDTRFSLIPPSPS